MRAAAVFDGQIHSRRRAPAPGALVVAGGAPARFLRRRAAVRTGGQSRRPPVGAQPQQVLQPGGESQQVVLFSVSMSPYLAAGGSASQSCECWFVTTRSLWIARAVRATERLWAVVQMPRADAARSVARTAARPDAHAPTGRQGGEGQHRPPPCGMERP